MEVDGFQVVFGEESEPFPGFHGVTFQEVREHDIVNGDVRFWVGNILKSRAFRCGDVCDFFFGRRVIRKAQEN